VRGVGLVGVDDLSGMDADFESRERERQENQKQGEESPHDDFSLSVQAERRPDLTGDTTGRELPGLLDEIVRLPIRRRSGGAPF
jgi:hypothetical protein